MKDPRRRAIHPAERIQQNIDFLSSRIVTKRLPIAEWEYRQGYYRSPGVYDFKSDWRLYAPDMEWGGPDVTALFRARARIPDTMANETVWVRLVPGGEGILKVNGRAVYGLDFNHREYRLTVSATAGDTYDLELECYFRDAPDDAIRNDIRLTHHLRESELQVKDREIESVYYDFQAALDAATSLPEDSEQARGLLHALQQAVALFNPYSPSSEETRTQILAAGRHLRNELYDHGRFAPPGLLHLVGHCHIDVWYVWPYRESIRKNRRTNLIVADLAERYPQHVFAQSQAKLFHDLKTWFPEEYARVKALVAEGRYEPAGGMWVEPDANLPSGESMVRQILYGQAFFQREFGRRSTVCWMPDVFGAGGSLPQILVDGGYRLFYTNKQSVWHDTNEFPHDTFLWEGIDGSRIVAHLPPTHFVGKMDPHSLREQWSDYQQKREAPHVLYTYGFGDGGGGPTERMIEYAQRLGRMDGMPRLAFTSAEAFADALVGSARDLPVWADELYLEMHRGVQTTKGDLKRMNRAAESALRSAEILDAAAEWLSPATGTTPQSLEPLWKILLECQFHDGVTGTHCTEAGKELAAHYQDLLTRLASRREATCRRIVPAPAPDRATVFQLAGGQTSGHLLWEGPDGTTLADEDGTFPTQRLSDGRNLTWMERLPTLGHKVLALRLRAPADNGGAGFRQNASEMCSPFHHLRFDTQGRIAGWTDLGNEREVLSGAGNRFEIYEDRPGRFEAWDIAKDYPQRPVPAIEFKGSRAGEDGPLLSSRVFTWQVGASSLEQEIRLYAHSHRVDFRTRVDWREERKLLRVYFPFAVLCGWATYEIAFGHIVRTARPANSFDLAKFEVPFHRWFDVAEHGYGIAILNDGKYGGCVRDGTASLSLLKSPTFPDPSSDRGIHEFTYSLLPHRDDWRAAGVLEEAALLNTPMRLVQGAALTPRTQYLDVSPAGVSVESIKPPEDGDGWVLRLVDYFGQGGKVTVRLPFVPASVEPCTVLEEPCKLALTVSGDTFAFAGRPFGIFSFRLRL